MALSSIDGGFKVFLFSILGLKKKILSNYNKKGKKFWLILISTIKIIDFTGMFFGITVP